MLKLFRNLYISRATTGLQNKFLFSTVSSTGSKVFDVSSREMVSNIEKKDEDLLNISTSKSTKSEEKDRLYSRLEIELKGVDPAVLKSYTWFTTTAANHLGIEIGNCWALRKPYHDRLTLLKSVHIYKKHRVQYEIRTYFRYMIFHKLTGSTLNTFLTYIEMNLPEGVALKATKIEIQDIPEHLKEPPSPLSPVPDPPSSIDL